MKTECPLQFRYAAYAIGFAIAWQFLIMAITDGFYVSVRINQWSHEFLHWQGFLFVCVSLGIEGFFAIMISRCRIWAAAIVAFILASGLITRIYDWITGAREFAFIDTNFLFELILLMLLVKGYLEYRAMANRDTSHLDDIPTIFKD